MSTGRPNLADSLERLSHSDLIAVMRDLLGAFAKLGIEHQAVKDEFARHKKLPSRPPQNPRECIRRRIDPSVRPARRRPGGRRGGAAATWTS
jgi:hypothetical protein